LNEFVDLSDGMTYYQIEGPNTGRTVVLIHGIAVPCGVWDTTTNDLVTSGFRVLRYDLYGRGRSDRPKVRYDHLLFDRQLSELLTKLEIDTPVDLVGLSLGALIALIFTDRYPKKVRNICLIDPVGFGLVLPFEAKLVRFPILGEFIMGMFGETVIMRELSKGLCRQEKIPEFLDMAKPLFLIPGFKRAFLSTLRNIAYEDMSDVYSRVGEKNHPVLLIWGQEDHSVPISNSKKVIEAIPHLEFFPIDGAGHLPHYERPEVVNPKLIEFLHRSISHRTLYT
jgi:pimeloyl-ACP methyl ester carboxylesterase